MTSKTTIQKIVDENMRGRVNLDLVTLYKSRQSAHLQHLKPTSQKATTVEGCLKKVDDVLSEVETSMADDPHHRRWL